MSQLEELDSDDDYYDTEGGGHEVELAK